MPLSDFITALDELATQALAAFQATADKSALETARVEFLGAKNGRLKLTQQRMTAVDPADRPAAGQKLNQVKSTIQAAFEAASQRLESAALVQHRDPQFDPTLPGIVPKRGHLHPITQTIAELTDIMGRLGFTVADGPEIEDEWHNFDALNIPLDHPARDPLDNFYLATAGRTAGDGPLLLRSQTSTVQIRVMERQPPPVRIIALGRVYRPDQVDETHYPMFHQMEGLLIDQGITMADLKSVLRLFASSYLGTAVHIRFRPSFFPFTEPSVEVDMHWQDRWIEMGGAGMVDPRVLEAVGYDPEQVTGFAFGLGIERLCGRRHGITDIRNFHYNDVRFLHQF
ncbi:MAG: phenylalanine--tRNA ligase subunit alpha [Planctomycetes bacterium]|nr:phenylalanine--tRNA ligase subunit alpha [Planctomycetota bacterium]